MSIRDDRRLRALMATAVVSLLALLVLAAIFIANAKSTSPSAPGFKDATVYPGGSSPSAPTMKLEDAASAKTFDSATLDGRPYVVTFLYTHCPDVCPLIGAELRQALADLGPAARKLNVIALSVDPRGDTRSAVRAWLGLHHEPANFHYLIGSEAELKPYWDAWHVGPQIVGDPDSSHTAAIYLITAQNRIAGIVDAGTQIPNSDLVHDFRSLIARAERDGGQA